MSVYRKNSGNFVHKVGVSSLCRYDMYPSNKVSDLLLLPSDSEAQKLRPAPFGCDALHEAP